MANHRRRRAFYIHSPTVVVINKKPGTELAKLANSPDAPARAYTHFVESGEPDMPENRRAKRESCIPTGTEDAAACHPVANPCPLVYKTAASNAFAIRPQGTQKRRQLALTAATISAPKVRVK